MSTRKTTITVDVEILDDLDCIAKSLDTPRNTLIAQALKQFVDKNKEKAAAIDSKRKAIELEIAEMKGE